MIRYGVESDYDKAKKIWEECFVDTEEEVDFYFKNLYHKDKFLLLEEEGKILSSLHENPYEISINDNTFKSFYIVAVAVLPQYRGRGYMGELIKTSLVNAYKKGVPFVYLSPINPEIYRRYAFEYVTKLNTYTLLTINLPDYKLASYFEIKKIEWDSEIETMRELVHIYEEEMKDSFLCVKRDERYYLDLVREMTSDEGGIYGIYKDNKMTGYVAFYKREDKIEIREIFGVDKESIEGLLYLIKTFKEYYPNLEIKTPIFNRIERFLGNEKLVEKKESPFIMGRITNLTKIFEMCDIDFQDEIKIYVKDDIILENSGIYTLKNGVVTQDRKNRDDFHIKLDIRDLTSLIFGTNTLEELIFLGKVTVKSEKVGEILKYLSSKKNYIQDYQ